MNAVPHENAIVIVRCLTESRATFCGLLFAVCLMNSTVADEKSPQSRLTGVVTDAAGQALAGVRVDITTAAPKVGRGLFCPSCYRDCAKWATTDEKGRFQLQNLAPSLRFRLIATHSGFATSQTPLIDPDRDTATITLAPLQTDIPADRIVSAVITSEEGTPIAGAYIEPCGAKTEKRRWWGRVEGVTPTVTDTEGRFSMIVPDDFLALDIEVTADGFCGTRSLLLEPGTDIPNITVPVGAQVTGKLTHRGTPVAGMSIAVVQLERGTDKDIFVAAIGDVTAEDGSFRFQYLPPSQRYAIYSVVGDARRSHSKFVITTKLLSVPASGESRDLGILSVTTPVTIRGRVEHREDQPLSKNLKLTFGRKPAWDLIAAPVLTDGSFEATGLPPETYEIRIGSRDLVLAPEKLEYQMMGDRSFGIHVEKSVTELVIPVKGK